MPPFGGSGRIYRLNLLSRRFYQPFRKLNRVHGTIIVCQRTVDTLGDTYGQSLVHRVLMVEDSFGQRSTR